MWSSYSSIVNSICPGSAPPPPPLDDSGSSFTDLRVVYHLIIIALSHYFLCCILWALSLNQALNHYYILFSYICSLSATLFLLYSQTVTNHVVHTKAFIKSMNKRETFCSCCFFCCAEIAQLLLCLYQYTYFKLQIIFAFC